MFERFLIDCVVENGYSHYKVYDKITNRIIHCDKSEINEAIYVI